MTSAQRKLQLEYEHWERRVGRLEKLGMRLESNDALRYAEGMRDAYSDSEWIVRSSTEAATKPPTPNCTCPAGVYNPGNVHENYCNIS